MAKTIFDKIWEKHLVKEIGEGTFILYIDRHFIHEVTSPQAFTSLAERGRRVFRPKQSFATCDHNVPTLNQDKPIVDDLSRKAVEALAKNTKEHGISYFPLGDPRNGIVHVIGPEQGITQSGMTIVCGDSHTSTHGAFGNIAFGIGTSEVEMVLATQTLIQQKPKQMLLKIDGELQKGVTSKDLILHIISKVGSAGGTGHFLEFAGSTIDSLSMEERMTICNMSIELGARGGIIAPDQTTFDYLKGRPYSPKGEEWVQSVANWRKLKSDSGANYDTIYAFDASKVEPMITYGVNPGMGMAINDTIPKRDGEERALQYMGLQAGEKMEGMKIDYIFLGSCTNGRIEDFRLFASLVKGHKKAEGVTAWLVPGSKGVEKSIKDEGLEKILNDAGFELRQPGCSACLGMNEDKVPAGKYALSTSNRNFEGRQGPGARTILCGVLVAAAAAITGEISDPRKFLK